MENILAEIIIIGDEILYGQTLDTNSHWISGELDRIGIRVIRKTTVGDQEERILEAFEDAERRAQLILITGGLGPTNDDLTKPCLAKYFHADLLMNAEALEDVTAFLKSKGREMTELNRNQALFPVGAKIIRNRNGTAPGIWMEKNGKVFISMPGVPHEMREMMAGQVIPELKRRFHVAEIYHKIVNTVGIGESWLADKIRSWENNLPPYIRLAYLPSPGFVKLRLTAVGDDIQILEGEVKRQLNTLKTIIDKYIYGYDNIKLEETVGQMLAEKGKTLAIAESCSGGYVSHLITTIPGSSLYFKGGIISYDNAVKISMLGVSEETLRRYGAVSEQTVREMAEGVREKLQTDYGISVSGIAGPDGGTEDKPVGTVWIAVTDGYETIANRLQLGKDRLINIRLSAINALNLLRQRLM